MLSRTNPACSAEVEALIARTIGCAIQVHRTLGPGYTEAVYHDALAIELDIAHLPFEREFPVTVMYRDRPLRRHRLDLVVGGAVVVELKAVERLSEFIKRNCCRT